MKYLLLIFVTVHVSLAGCAEPASDQVRDLLITNATVIDGSGAEAFEADILIDNGVIIRIGEIDPVDVRADRILNAAGRIVSPGFIDTHSHGNPLDTPLFENFLAMGVTTISLGQDGRSPSTEDVGKWMDDVDELSTGPNILHFKGHGTLRELADVPRRPGIEPSQMEAMKRLLDESMQAGSFGMTTGLEYFAGRFADMTELTELASVVAGYDGLVMSHIRSEDDDKIEEAVDELLQQGRESGARVHLSHLKIVYANDTQRAEDILRMLSQAREEGIQVTADLYPYTASFTGIGIVFPDWAQSEEDFNDAVENRRDELEQYLRNRIQLRNGPEATLFGTEPWTGRTLAEVADSLNLPFEKVLIDHIGPGGASAAYFVMNEDVMKRFLIDPTVMISSDGSPTMRHPRGYGSFAKIISEFVQEERLLSLEEAVFKMSGLPASTLGLDDRDLVSVPRGYIREGFAADILIFNPDNVRDRATFDQPHRLAEGFDWVFVNGSPAVENGQPNDQRSGKVIRRIVH